MHVATQYRHEYQHVLIPSFSAFKLMPPANTNVRNRHFLQKPLNVVAHHYEHHSITKFDTTLLIVSVRLPSARTKRHSSAGVLMPIPLRQDACIDVQRFQLKPLVDAVVANNNDAS